jgi:sialic acid synthase SpsE
MATIKIGNRVVGEKNPTYFIADISANHDGDLERAKMLIRLAAKHGADAAKFQNFRANKIVSGTGFAALGKQVSHQSKWNKTVVEVYEGASLEWEWTPFLRDEAVRSGIEYFSTPYDIEAVDMLDPFVEVYKIGSGDITWTDMILKVASKKKPVLIACGASSIGDVQRAMNTLLSTTTDVVLMQCNTNYTGSLENFKYINLNVLRTFSSMYPDVVLGLSDHTPGHATALGAVALGARVIEKHFTDDCSRLGPDHPFSLDPLAWKEMVNRTRELECALGSGDKRVEDNEKETVVIQRRSARAVRDLEAGTVLTPDLVEVLRPAPSDALLPYELERLWGRVLRRDLRRGEHLCWSLID